MDTLIVNAGVSTLQPLLVTAGLQRDEIHTRMTNLDGLTRVRDVAGAAMRGNFTGPLLSAVTYVSILSRPWHQITNLFPWTDPLTRTEL